MSYDRELRSMNARYRRQNGWTKALLVEALRNVQHLCPPRVTRQDKRDLERIVNGALNLPDEHPMRHQMQAALAAARQAEGR